MTKYTRYIKTERAINGRIILTTGVDRHDLNYTSHGKVVHRIRVVTTERASFLYSAYEGYAHTPYFSPDNPFMSRMGYINWLSSVKG